MHYNEIRLAGRLLRDPELISMESKFAQEEEAGNMFHILKLTIISDRDPATPRRSKVSIRSRVTISVEFAGARARDLNEIGLKMGDQILVVGQLNQRRWKTRFGVNMCDTGIRGVKLDIVSRQDYTVRRNEVKIKEEEYDRLKLAEALCIQHAILPDKIAEEALAIMDESVDSGHDSAEPTS